MPLLYIHPKAMRKSPPLYCYAYYSQRVSLFIIPLPIEYNKTYALFQALLRKLITFCEKCRVCEKSGVCELAVAVTAK